MCFVVTWMERWENLVVRRWALMCMGKFFFFFRVRVFVIGKRGKGWKEEWNYTYQDLNSLPCGLSFLPLIMIVAR